MSASLDDDGERTGFVWRLATSWQRSRLARWAAASTTYRTGRVIWRAWEFAVVTSMLRRIGRWVRASYLYRWLTTEPEPEVIVIDLRDTYTVAPFIMILDHAISALSASYRHSRLRQLGAKMDQTASGFADTRAGRLLTATLAPPEPPDETSAAEPDVSEETDSPAEKDEFRFPDG